MPAKLSSEEFVKRAKAVHGDTYDYSRSFYELMSKPIRIVCKVHGSFFQKPDYHIQGCGCPKCGIDSRSSLRFKGQETFLAEAAATHGSKYDYSKSEYRSARSHLTITCRLHGDFQQTPWRHVKGHGCPQCALVTRSKSLIWTKRKFIREAEKRHGSTYIYTKSKYAGANKPIRITCKIHGDFCTTPSLHINSRVGCPKCGSYKGWSKVSIRWLEEYSKSHRWKNVQHALNGGEYVVPGTNFRVDGYHRRSNTILEFYGDAFHGNPNLYKESDKPHPFSNLTAKELYAKTLDRESKLRQLGYKIVFVWESDYRGSLN